MKTKGESVCFLQEKVGVRKAGKKRERGVRRKRRAPPTKILAVYGVGRALCILYSSKGNVIDVTKIHGNDTIPLGNSNPSRNHSLLKIRFSFTSRKPCVGHQAF